MLATLISRPRVCRGRVFAGCRIGGFTLIELMVTVTLAGILAVIAVPSFRQFILNQRLKNASYDLVSALSLTRSEAITRNAAVSMVAKGGDWANGWCVTTAADCTAAAIVQHSALNRSITVSAYLLGTSTAGPTTITFGNSGRMSSAATVFAIAPATAVSGVKTRCVTLSLAGTSHISAVDTGSCS